MVEYNIRLHEVFTKYLYNMLDQQNIMFQSLRVLVRYNA